jgi:hypothetical protein
MTAAEETGFSAAASELSLIRRGSSYFGKSVATPPRTPRP